MKDLNNVEIKLINDLAMAGMPKKLIADKLAVDKKTVLNCLHATFPESEGSCISTRKRSSGAYKGKKQVLATINQYVQDHPFATNKEIMIDCKLPTKFKTTVSRWLKQLGIGCYNARRRTGITPINADRR